MALWFVDAAFRPGVTTEDAEGALGDADGNAVFENGLATVLGARGVEGAEAMRVHCLHGAVVERKCMLIDHDRGCGDLANHGLRGHRSLAR